MLTIARRVLICSLAVGVLAASPAYPAAQGVQAAAAIGHHAARVDDVLAAVRRSARIGPASELEPVRLSSFLRGGPVPEPGDLVTSAGVLSRAVRVVEKNLRGRVVRQPLAESFVSRGIAFDPISGLVAIAAVDRVLLYAPDTGELTEITALDDDDVLRFANDVLFDEDGLLIIADQGASPAGKDPADGRIWEYDPATGATRRLGGRRKLSNPSLLATDSRGRVFVVDAEAGKFVSPLLDVRWDMVYRLRGAQRKGAKRVFKGEGLQATAFDIGPDDRMWFGNVSEIAVLDGKDLVLPCPLAELPFEFITGLTVVGPMEARVADGSDVVSHKRKIFDVDDQCSARIRIKGTKINEIRGLARVAAPSGE